MFEISQLQSAQDRVVLARTNAFIVRGEHYELVAMRDPGAKTLLAGSTQCILANYVKFSPLLFAKGRQKRCVGLHLYWGFWAKRQIQWQITQLWDRAP